MTYLKAPMKQSNQCSPQRANMRMRSSKRGYTNNHPNLSVNVLEKENEYLIELAVPGYKKR